MKSSSTIDDVAKAAGVARVTVSRVLNNGANVRPETRERVRKAVEALGYSVNQQARALASGAARQIMLIHAHSPDLEPNSYYNSGLELGALRGCSSLGFDLVARAVDPDDDDRFRLLASIIERERPAGLILSPPLSDDIDFIAIAQDAGVGVVAVSAGERARGRVLAVGIDERAAGHAVGRHLTLLGHRSVGYVKGPHEHRSAALRYTGFLEALREANIAVEPWTATGDFTFRSGVEAAEQLLRGDTGVTAIACANDDMAAGVMLALHRAGRDIPGAISVTGFDDTPMSEVVWPPLTTIRQPIKDLTERAVHLLGENRPNDDVQHELLPFELVIRESTARPPLQGPA
ncbi:LacI family DNA-binding transcriptional regulator [Sphingomonas sp.]|uniref:LacI family DNA-binding transcriptional regulator n=1 Tax=Sphingomonas sp. TaxID=28214 RepID=UPI0025E5DA29|nr:LacI family DNA-binding transcriptional regulator [Sphingomonas sp.]MBV9528978.1 LacI family DNA-binding transcriptional regulator [Sphingomonas sp.]